MSLQLPDTQKYQNWSNQFQQLQDNFITPEKEKIEQVVLKRSVEAAMPLHQAMKELRDLPENAPKRDKFFAIRKFLMAKENAKDVTKQLSVYNTI